MVTECVMALHADSDQNGMLGAPGARRRLEIRPLSAPPQSDLMYVGGGENPRISGGACGPDR